jgi:hypothetical protein
VSQMSRKLLAHYVLADVYMAYRGNPAKRA